MRNAKKRSSVYVVYPAALCDGWEVVKEHADEAVSFDTQEEAIAYARARAVMEGGALVKVENWFGDTESICDVVPQTDRHLVPTAS